MKLYRYRPFEAFQLTADLLFEFLSGAEPLPPGVEFVGGLDAVAVRDCQGLHPLDVGDWVAYRQGRPPQRYSNDLFRATFEEVGDDRCR